MRNKQFELTGVTESEFKVWCKENKMDPLKESTKKEFFKLVLDGKIVRDSSTNKIISSNNE